MKPLALLLSLAALAGCAGESTAPPVSTAGAASIGSDAGEPQPPNSLPRGAAVNQPLFPAAGNVGTTRVGPR